MLRKLYFIFSLFLLSAGAFAQGVTVTAHVDKTAITLDDELTLTIEVKGASGNMLMPELPSLPAFNVYSREVEQSTVNFDTVTVFRYIMLPRFVGKAAIGAISFNYAGKTYKTDPIEVRVYRSPSQVQNSRPASTSVRAVSNASQSNFDSGVAARAAAPAAEETVPEDLPPLQRSLLLEARKHTGENFFLVAAVSETAPYVNQTVTLAVRFYYSQTFYDAPYSKPSVTNIFMEDLGSAQGSQTIGGRMYRYQEQRYGISGAAAGKAEIGPAMVKYTTGGNSALSALDRLFGGAAVGEERVAQSAPITLSVRALPAQDKPQSFYGAVGRGYTITADADHQKVEAGEAVNLTVTVKGPGNLKPTSDLKMPAVSGFRVYDVATTSGTLPSGGTVQSYKTFKTVLVPSSSGIYTIPAIAWSYFDPAAKEYRTVRTHPIQITVTPSTKAESGFDFGANQAVSNGFRTLGKDIAYLKTSAYPARENVLERIAKLGLVNFMMLLVLLGCTLYALFGKKTLAHKRAFGQAKARLKKAYTEEAVADAVSEYLQDKCGLSIASLPLRDLTQALRMRGVAAATADEFAQFWQRLDAARFAPVALGVANGAGLAAQALELLKKLEGELK